ncbi:ThuA domain-containing protein [Pelagicoccus mobilis]|uniref:ThuA domain-containing protein n=1 Tax=Pelagicoccus mobilis TaxID=415221 RepID=A0A934VNU6_9BACT|nr:ThuA domain-containing protein [Pelagicoccus mobilis]MBK1880326.1 ThuA domain-containing protein [Pelagicoccus mobilis]
MKTLARDQKETSSERIDVLIVDGFGNHDWRLTTEYLKAILESDGRFAVSVSTCPNRNVDKEAWEKWNPDFASYPVVIQICNDINDTERSWPNRVEEAFEGYVSAGGGVYMHHSANNAFKDWDAYNLMIGLGWRGVDFGVSLIVDDKENVVVIPKGEGEKTSHGKRFDALVTRMGDHPIHEGLPKQWIAADLEVYRYARGPAENLEVISYAREPRTGLNTPIEWVVSFGKGRVYSSTYGHVWKDSDWPAGIRCRAFQVNLVRALQWLSGEKVETSVPVSFPNVDKASLSKPLSQ